MVVLRGFSGVPILPDFGAGYKLNPAAIAAYPMYRGLAHLVGMKIIPAGGDFDAELDALEAVSDEHDFIFLHYKPADAAGEDGNFDAKVRTGWRSWTPGYPACWPPNPTCWWWPATTPLLRSWRAIAGILCRCSSGRGTPAAKG